VDETSYPQPGLGKAKMWRLPKRQRAAMVLRFFEDLSDVQTVPGAPTRAIPGRVAELVPRWIAFAVRRGAYDGRHQRVAVRDEPRRVRHLVGTTAILLADPLLPAQQPTP
jgi:hypothetical protein